MSAGKQSGRAKTQRELEQENARLQRELERLRVENERLRRELDLALRATKRQAAPYSKGKRVSKPKPPGRKPGQGKWSRRRAPAADEVKGPAVEVPVTETVCGECGEELEWERTDEVSVTDVPPQHQPQATVYQIEVRRCRGCGRRVRGRHPDVAPDQQGATAHRVGPRTKAVAHALHYGIGVPVRQVPKVLRELVGIKITQGALTHDALKRGRGEVGRAYKGLRATVQEASVVYTDDTGWRVGGKSAQLMVFDTDRATVYQIRPQHRNEEVRELVPSNYGGTLVADRGKSYDAEELREVAQQKCLAHILRNVVEVVETKSGRARSFGLHLKDLLRDAIDLGKRRGDYTPGVLAFQIQEIDDLITWHLRDRHLTDIDNQRLLDGIGYHHDHGRLLRFLEDPAVEPTNNRSERALRGAVIARKVSHCSKNEDGAMTFAAFTSVIRSAMKNGCVSLTDMLGLLTGV